MTPEERAGMAAAIQEAIALACAAVRQEHEQALSAIRRDLDASRLETVEIQRSLTQRCEDAERRADQMQRELDEAREPPISAMLVDGVGDLHIVQRGGHRETANMTQLSARIASEVVASIGSLGAALRAEILAHVAREAARLGSAPKWSRTAFYGEGAVVSCYVGRTYELKAGVRASMAQEPGEHPEIWQRIGSHGLRVMKSKPEQLEAGDVFTEGESRFIHDGETTTLFVPRAPKQSDIDRTFKAAHSLAQSAMEHATHAERLAEAHEPRLETVERVAANSQAWIDSEGDAAVLRSAITERWVEIRRELIDSPEFARVVARAPEIDIMLDQQRQEGIA